MQDSTRQTMTNLKPSGHQEQDVTFNVSETSALLKRKESPSLSVWKQRYRNSGKFVSSKAAILILLWSLLVDLIYRLDYITSAIDLKYAFRLTCIIYAGNGILLCFYPLAGFLADNKFGRYNTVIKSLYALVPTAWTAALISLLLSIILTNMTSITDGVILIAPSVIIVLVCIPILIGFNANVIQFGMDQLYDSPADHQSLFLHWYLWVQYFGLLFTQLVWKTFHKINTKKIVIVYFLLVVIHVVVILLIISLYIARHRPNWFLTEPARLNPYKLVHQVTKFAHQHKFPVHRSAFTYCEDEVPSGLDLGKNKYGGPFTTEQVEDVKVFYGILKVLFALGPMYLLDFSTDPMVYFYARHGSICYNNNSDNATNDSFFNRAILFPLLIVVCIPLYVCLLRPFIMQYIPGMLKRLGLGIIMMAISLICTFLIDITYMYAQEKPYNSTNFTNTSNNSTTPLPPYQDIITLVIQCSLHALSTMLIYIALYEFICSQSPHSMKGLLIGLSFAIEGVFKVIATVLILPFLDSFPSWEMVYYLVNIGVGVLAVLVFTCVAKRYKYRERDEPCHVRRYVEDYYSNTGPEDNDSLPLPDTKL